MIGAYNGLVLDVPSAMAQAKIEIGGYRWGNDGIDRALEQQHRHGNMQARRLVFSIVLEEAREIGVFLKECRRGYLRPFRFFY